MVAVPLEKKSVAFLYCCNRHEWGQSASKDVTYFKNGYKISDNPPILVVQLIFAQLQGLVSRNGIDWLTILENEGHHVICRIPSCDNITGDDVGFESALDAMLTPSREGKGC